MENVEEKVNDSNGKFVWTEERAAKFKALLSQNLTYRQMVEEMGEGCTLWRVGHALKCLRSGRDIPLGPRAREFTEDEDAEITRLFVEEEMPMVQIARRLGIHRDMVRRRLDVLGLYSDDISFRRKRSEIVQRARKERAQENVKLVQSWKEPLRSLWTARSEQARAKLYGDHRYEDAPVPKHVPRCGRVG